MNRLGSLSEGLPSVPVRLPKVSETLGSLTEMLWTPGTPDGHGFEPPASPKDAGEYGGKKSLEPLAN